MCFEITDAVSARDKQAIYAALTAYNLTKLEDKHPKALGVYHRVDGEVKAGLLGETHGNWLRVDCLWVADDLRGSGIGSKILAAAEQEAVQRGCRYAFLYTGDFQAPKFYLKHGYREVLTLKNFPLHGERYYYIKDLV